LWLQNHDKEAEEERIEEIIKETSKLQIINNEPLDEYNNIKTSLNNKDNQIIDNINNNKLLIFQLMMIMKIMKLRLKLEKNRIWNPKTRNSK
jgi:hypothetical protein